MAKREYLSWSQFNLYTNSKSRYIKQYFEWEESFVTKEIRYWKGFAEKAEKWLIDIPKLDEVERRLEVVVDWVKCLWFLDSSEASLSKVYEYKTWKTPWTQEKANNHWQLKFYAVMIYELLWQIPEFELFWFKTKDWKNWIEETWEVETFKVNHTKKEILEFKKEMIKVWNEIQEMYEVWLNWSTENIDILTLYEYAWVTRDIKNLEAVQKELKQKIKIPENWFDIPWIWKYFYSNKSKIKWELPEDISNKIKKAEEKYTEWIEKNTPKELLINIEKAEEEKKEWEEKAEREITQILNFKLSK